MRFKKIRAYLDSKNWPYRYTENNDCGGIDFNHRGLAYHIWEYPEPERGAQSNVLGAGRMIDYEDNYEEQILDILKSWEGTW